MANFNTFKVGTMIFLVGVLLSGHLPWVSAIFGDKVHVYLINGLEPGIALNIHCKSKNDDLGFHTIGFDQTYEFSFHNNVWDTTLFWCSLWWNKPGQKVVSGSFNIYKGKRDELRCLKRCPWKIKERGLYSYNSNNGIWENLYNWP